MCRVTADHVVINIALGIVILIAEVIFYTLMVVFSSHVFKKNYYSETLKNVIIYIIKFKKRIVSSYHVLES